MRDIPRPIQNSTTLSTIDLTTTYDYETEEEVLSTVIAYLDFSTELKTFNSTKSRSD